MNEKAAAILIDDDPLIRSLWQISARKAAIQISLFSTPAEFFSQAKNFEKNTVVYIDSKLANGERGEEVAKEIFAAGFKEIYLVTGYGQDSFPPMPWIRRILPKDPPWDLA